MTFFSSPHVLIGRTSVIRPCERRVFFWMRRGGLGRLAISLAFPPLESRSFFGAYPRSQPANIRGQYGRGHRPLKPHLGCIHGPETSLGGSGRTQSPSVPFELLDRPDHSGTRVRASSFFRHHQFFIQLPADLWTIKSSVK